MTIEDLANGSWRTWIIGALFAILSFVIGIGIDEQRKGLADLRLDMRRVEAIVQINGNRITRLEETRDFQQRQLDRIEKGVQDLIAQHGRR